MDKPEKNKNVDFESLVKHIQHTSEALQQDAQLVINRNVTTMAWVTGFYIWLGQLEELSAQSHDKMNIFASNAK